MKLASELLLDDSWRQRYNQFMNNKTMQAKRIAKQSDKRKQFISDLLAREKKEAVSDQEEE